MKVTMEFDCTPDEARQFLGLPDVKPMQKAVMDRMEKQVLDAADAFTPESVLRYWFTFLPQGQEQFQDMFGRMFLSGLGSARKDRE